MINFKLSKFSLALIAILAILIIGLLAGPKILSYSSSKYELINPDSSFYSLKRFTENFNRFFVIQDKQKNALNLVNLLDKRLREASYLAEKSKLSYLETAVSRYQTTAGSLIDSLGNLDQNTSTKIKAEANNQLKILETLRDRFPANNSYWLMFQQSIDTIKRIVGS